MRSILAFLYLADAEGKLRRISGAKFPQGAADAWNQRFLRDHYFSIYIRDRENIGIVLLLWLHRTIEAAAFHKLGTNSAPFME